MVLTFCIHKEYPKSFLPPRSKGTNKIYHQHIQELRGIHPLTEFTLAMQNTCVKMPHRDDEGRERSTLARKIKKFKSKLPVDLLFRDGSLQCSYCIPHQIKRHCNVADVV